MTVTDTDLNRHSETSAFISQLFFFITTPPVLANVRAASSGPSRNLKRSAESANEGDLSSKQRRSNASTATRGTPGPSQLPHAVVVRTESAAPTGPRLEGYVKDICRDYHCECKS